MVQILKAKPSFGSKFSATFNPAFQQGLNRFLEEDAAEEKEQRALQKRAANAKALGIDQNITDPTLQAAVYKEKAKTDRNQELLKHLTGQMPEGETGEGISDSGILGIGLENSPLAQLLQRQKEASEKMNLKREEIEREPIKKGVENFFTEAQREADTLGELELTTQSLIDAIQSGEADPFSSSHLGEIAASLGVPESITNILQTPGSKQFDSARKSALKEILRSTFRGTTSKKEIELAESLIAQVGINPKANLAAAFLFQSNVMRQQEKQNLIREAEQKGISNYKIPGYVRDKLEAFNKQLTKEFLEAVRELSQ